jgi:hypothetical protein
MAIAQKLYPNVPNQSKIMLSVASLVAMSCLPFSCLCAAVFIHTTQDEECYIIVHCVLIWEYFASITGIASSPEHTCYVSF